MTESYLHNPLIEVKGFGSSTAFRAEARQKPTKRPEQAAWPIAKDIVSQDPAAGERLPHEPELLKQHAVSRASITEAIRLLEVQELIAVRSRPGLGTSVSGVNTTKLAGTLGLYFLMTRVSLDELLSARLTVEPLLAQMVAENEDREKVENFIASVVLSSKVIQESLRSRVCAPRCGS